MPTVLVDRGSDIADTAGPGAPGEPPTATRPVLVEAGLVAARERERQRRRAGGTGALALLAGLPAAVRRLGSAEAAESGLRYQPVVWSLIAITAVAFFLPGRPSGIGIPGPVAAPVAQAAPATTSPPRASTAPSTPTGGVPVASPAPVRPSRPVAVGGAAPPIPSPVSSAPTSPPGPGPGAPAEPLTVRGHGWAATAPILAGATVPEGTLPVANRLGSTDKVSFVRLDGSAPTLRLTEDPEGAVEALGDASVALCPVEGADWEETPGQSLDDAPTWGEDCVGGVEDDGTWTFDLTGLGDPTADTGFALVPGPDAPAEFQVSFVP